MTATHLIAVGTIDEPVLELINLKRSTVAQAVDGVSETQAAESVERMLLARFGDQGAGPRRQARRKAAGADEAEARRAAG